MTNTDVPIVSAGAMPPMSKPSEADAIIPSLHSLLQDWPQCFKPGKAKPPLERGIDHDLLLYDATDARLTSRAIRQALKKYTGHWHYLHHAVVGANRLDLTGQVAGQVSVLEATYAQQRLHRLRQQSRQRQSKPVPHLAVQGANRQLPSPLTEPLPSRVKPPSINNGALAIALQNAFQVVNKKEKDHC